LVDLTIGVAPFEHPSLGAPEHSIDAVVRSSPSFDEGTTEPALWGAVFGDSIAQFKIY
jgi:hypothetical protein